MRIVSLRDTIIWPVVSRMGFDPNFDLTQEFSDALSRYVNAWVPKTWEAADWPELTRIESRVPVNHLVPYDAGVQPPPPWIITNGYNLDDVVRDPGALLNVYTSVQNANTGHALSDSAWWTKINVWNNTDSYIPLQRVADPLSGIVYVSQAYIKPGSAISASLEDQRAWVPLYTQNQPVQLITDIGKVLKVYLVDPTLNDGPFDIPFRLMETSFHVGYDHGTTVWVKFIQRPSRYTLTPWDQTVTYNLGNLVYDILTGDCFVSTVGNNINQPPSTSPGFWQLVFFPYVLASAVWRGVYSEALREDGQTAKADAEEKAAMAELELSIHRNLGTRYDRLTDQQTGVPRLIAQPVAPAA